ncbi:metallophosphoesterase [candidate division KSB3 bacterium]|uniref:Metallophosphoesterase n=1 Tax=candidate division KSB3 bacterium TaxID=2044937 RepID=A0A9D5Q667_9BACT|nr:metallophosphoesterase [candidate division KSB3 bacterium]MBD3325529.1 metallophosphoesterase [candidate division KSB3 bacterium]
MKYCIFSDIHGNLEALTAVLRQIEEINPDRVVCLGDVVGYGPNPNECIERVHQVADVTIMGNHDHAVLGLTDITYFNQYAKIAVLWTRQVLTQENVTILKSYPFQVSQDEILFVHSTPLHPERWDYIFSPLEGKYYLQHLQEHICFIGHSHQPLFFEEDAQGFVTFDRQQTFSLSLQDHCKYIVNIGSVGQPRDGSPSASFAVYDTTEQQVEVKRIPYNYTLTQKKMTELQLPEFLIDRLAYGR